MLPGGFLAEELIDPRLGRLVEPCRSGHVRLYAVEGHKGAGDGAGTHAVYRVAISA